MQNFSQPKYNLFCVFFYIIYFLNVMLCYVSKYQVPDLLRFMSGPSALSFLPTFLSTFETLITILTIENQNS